MRSSTVPRFGVVSILLLAACSANEDGVDSQPIFGNASGGAAGSSALSAGVDRSASGGANPIGGTTGSNSTAASAVGGSSSKGGTTNSGGRPPEGGSTSIGGASGLGGAGGSSAAAGKAVAAGGAKAAGGSAALGGRGGAAAGGAATGGRSAGGTPAGGNATGGKAMGGASAGGTSSGGSMTGGSAAGGTTNVGSDGCTNTLALGLTISEIAVFQTGKISVMKGGNATNAATPNGADVIEGRTTLFRVYVTTDSGFQARALSARLTLNGSSTSYYAKQTISATSTELSTTNSFQILVPASAITSSLNYSVEVVECGASTGTPKLARFPSSGTAAIATRATGVIKATLVPVTANGITPELSGVAKSLKTHLEALYPTTSAQLTVATTPITGCGISPATAADGTVWTSCLQKVRDRRNLDRPASDVYYLGLVTPAASYATYCGRSCIGGIGYVASTASSSTARALVSVGFDPQGLNTIAHELGHNHGLPHSPGCGADDPDTAFPYQSNGTSYIGWPGWDQRTPNTFFDPAKYTDLMAYCSPTWVSDYVYGKLADRVAALNTSAMLGGPDAASPWLVLDVVGGSASWGVPITNPIPPSGIQESAMILDAAGRELLEVTIHRTDIGGHAGSMYLVPNPAASWAAIRVGSLVVQF